MPISFRTNLLTVLSLALALALPESAVAQWYIGLDIGSERYWGGSIDNTPEHLSFRPYRPTTVGAVLQRRSGSLGAAVRLWYTDAAMALEGGEASVIANGVFTVISASPEISYRLLRLGRDNELLLHAGPLVELWDVMDLDSRTRVGGRGALSLTIPFGLRLAMSLAAYAAVIGSPFEEAELPDIYELRSLWRRGIAGGLRYRL